jgi:dihydrofolate reductase
MTVSFMVAMAKNRVIGVKQGLPWRIPADLKRFKAITKGHPVIMGRKTFDSIRVPLPDRENIVVSRTAPKIPNVKVVQSLKEALAPFESTNVEVFILGGGEIFKEALPFVDKIYLTLVEQNFEGDTYFPEINWGHFEKTFEETHTQPILFRFIDYVKKR